MTSEETRLFEENMKLVPWVLIHKLGILPTDPFFEDLKQEGYIALMKSACGYDASNGKKFVTYATNAIYNNCLCWKLRNCHPIKRTQIVVLNNYRKERPYTNEELTDFCKRNHVTRYTLQCIISANNQFSLDECVQPYSSNKWADDVDLHEMIADPNMGNELTLPEERAGITMKEIEGMWFKIAEDLNEKHRAIWIDYCYGLKFKVESGEKSVPEIIQRNIATKYGTSQSYVSRILDECVKKFRALVDERNNCK